MLPHRWPRWRRWSASPARANILCALLDGRALTAGELAFAPVCLPQTTSGHLAKLHDARLIDLCKQGRHRYYRLAGSHVGQMLESIMTVALTGPPRFQPRTKNDDQLRHARPATITLPANLASASPTA